MEFYFKVILKNVHRDQEDLLTSFCFEHGASGVSEDLQFRQTKDTYEPETIEAPQFNLQVFFETEIPTSFFDGIESEYSNVSFDVLREPNRDWLEEWKKGFKAFPLVDDIWVVPSWLEAPAEAGATIAIDPGMAFGTGTHATTQIASQLIRDAFKKENFKTVLDVGTGTGMLAVLAEHYGATQIRATEIEPMAREVAKENVELNKCKHIEILDVQVDAMVEKHQLVVANIIDGVLLQLKSDLVRLCDLKGTMILTGILEEREARFVEKFGIKSSEFEIVERLQKDEWVGYRLQYLGGES